ncbi:MAG: dimethylsulfide dehydrogenase [Gammaproteobacteria bacterium]|nr:MAG: dimethylsulfide dehydrogenase [Gammaproteobacteria bacterium]
MKKLDRRDFLKSSSIAGISVLSVDKAWSLTTLEPIQDTLKTDYPYRGWEDIYRREYEHDVVGFSAHCVNCHGNCAFKILARDGIVVREEQLAQYPQIAPDIPDTNPRGCQKGAIHSQAMYDPDRIRYPMKRAGERGEGKWQRISWDQVTEEIADKIIDLYEAHGPGCLATHTGTGTVSNGKLAAGLRFASLLGGIQEDSLTDVGDGQSGQYLAYGDNMQNATSDAWFGADYLLLSYLNVSVTRIPDAHYVWEAKYNGARVVATSPDYNPTAIHTDRWLNIQPGADPFLYMAMVHTILEENLVDEGFVREQTDLTLLVRDDNGKLLREADLEAGGKDDVFYLWDEKSGRAVKAPGSTGSEAKTLDLGAITPALKGNFKVGDITVQPAYMHMRAEAMKFSPEATREKTGIHPDIVRDEARRFAAAKKAVIAAGFASAKMLNGIYTQWAQILMCALTGHSGESGGYWSPFSMWGFESVFYLGFMQLGKTPRMEAGGLGEFVHGKKIIEARAFYNNDKLKARTGFDVEEMQHMIEEAVETGQMPVYEGLKGAILQGDNKFARNKGPHYRERMLEHFSELFVNINVRMDSTAMYAAYVLPAAGHYEGWDFRTTPMHRFGNLFTAPVKPIGEAKPEWELYVLLTKKIQERAIARGITAYQDGPVTRDLHTIHDDYTMGGKMMTAQQQVRFLVENSPQFQGQPFDEAVNKGFVTIGESPSPPSAKVTPDKPVQAWRQQLEDKVPYPTLSGRITFYCDHDWYQQLGSTVPTARDNAGPASSNYPYTFYTPHTRWGIHTTWRSNKYMMRLQRGEPNVYISPVMAAAKGIEDGSQVRVFNNLGEFYAQAKVAPTVRDNQVMMEHAWEPYQMREQKGLNHVVATLIQPLELVGNWGHLKFDMYKWNPNQLSNESGVDIESAERVQEA